MVTTERSIRIAHFTVIVAACFLSACAQESGLQPAEIEDAQDLMQALQDAGATVSETAMMAEVDLGGRSLTLQVNQAVVYVYQYESPEAREAVAENLDADGSTLGGAPLLWSERVNIWIARRLIVAYPGSDGGTILLLDGLLGDRLTQPAASLGEPFPPAVTAAVEFLAQKLNVKPVSVEVLWFDAENWPDACLGLAGSGEPCAAVETPGWRIRLRVGEEEFELHSDQVGAHVRVK